ncbi:hypothetical protein ME808_00880 [Lactobacillus delbrueckii]|nr:hypothetical protein ME808_00880 [Lactobacillus delbrueckii]
MYLAELASALGAATRPTVIAAASAPAIKMVPEMDPDQIVMVNLSGRGDKDVNQVAAYLGEEI